MFAVSHAFQTRITTALNLGYAFDLDKFGTQPAPTLARFAEHLKETQGHWMHPLVLPVIFLATHILRVESYLWHVIGPGVVAVKECIGVTKAGTSERQWLGMSGNQKELSHGRLFVDGKLHRGNAQRLTHTINDLSIWIIYTKRSPQWDIQCANFLLQLIESDHRLRNDNGTSAQLIQEAIHYIRNDSEACLEQAETAEAQMKLQLDIVSVVFYE